MNSPAIRVLLAEYAGEASPRIPLGALLSSTRPVRFEVQEAHLAGLSTEADLAALEQALRQHEPDLVLLCLPRSAGPPAAALLALARDRNGLPPVVVIGEFAGPEEVMELVTRGAADFVGLPLRASEVIPRLWSLARLSAPASASVPALRQTLGLRRILGESAVLAQLIQQVPRIARCDAPLLITGETGVGKELFARAVHYLSRRSSQPFVPVNCGAIPPDLVENEFFGHEAGAFTSASGPRRGIVKEAERGTLFLDEIDCLPVSAQIKLLRFLQDGQFRPLGAERGVSSDVRIIAASNADLAEALRSGQFRQDLYYRLNVLSLRLPPLRERPEDIPLLAQHFAGQYARRLGSPARTFSPTALQKLLSYDWPGNIRELQNVVERTVAMAERPIMGEADLLLPGKSSDPEEEGFQRQKDRVIERFERDYLQRLLLLHGGNITRAAASARKDRRAFWELMRKHRLCVPRTPRRKDCRAVDPRPPG